MNVTRLTNQQVAEAQQSVRRLPRKQDPESKQAQVESMDTTPQSDARKDSDEPKKLSKEKVQRDQSSERKDKRNRSGSSTQRESKKEDGRSTAPAPAVKAGRSESQPTTSKGPTNLTSTLTEAGGAKPPRGPRWELSPDTPTGGDRGR